MIGMALGSVGTLFLLIMVLCIAIGRDDARAEKKSPMNELYRKS